MEEKRSNVNKTFIIEQLCQLCGIKYKESSMSLSLKHSKTFFEKYRLGLKAIDLFGNITHKIKTQFRETEL